MDVADFEMIGGRPDIEYTCDLCGTCENDVDGNGLRWWVPIYRYEGQEICSWCLERILITREQLQPPPKIQWNLQGF